MSAEVLGTASQEAPAQAPWIPDDSGFGARLALIRQRMGWGNVKEAALACGLPPESWRTWERDNVSPHKYQRICEQIAQRAGCDLGWLLGDRQKLNAPRTPNERSPQPRPFSRRTRAKVRAARTATRRSSPVHPSQRRPTMLRPPSQPMAVR